MTHNDVHIHVQPLLLKARHLHVHEVTLPFAPVLKVAEQVLDGIPLGLGLVMTSDKSSEYTCSTLVQYDTQ